MVTPLEELLRLATSFRAALERIALEQPDKLSISFAHFPRGSCGDATIMLMEYLAAARGAHELTYVSGRRSRPDFYSHAWCEVDGFFVDITGDQFGRDPTVVREANADRWFDQWGERRRVERTSPGYMDFARPSLFGLHAVVAATEQ
jgi:hypothetical protein